MSSVWLIGSFFICDIYLIIRERIPTMDCVFGICVLYLYGLSEIFGRWIVVNEFIDREPVYLIIMSQVLITVIPYFIIVITARPDITDPSSYFYDKLVSLCVDSSSFSVGIFHVGRIPPRGNIATHSLGASTYFCFRKSVAFLYDKDSFFI